MWVSVYDKNEEIQFKYNKPRNQTYFLFSGFPKYIIFRRNKTKRKFWFTAPYMRKYRQQNYHIRFKSAIVLN